MVSSAGDHDARPSATDNFSPQSWLCAHIGLRCRHALNSTVTPTVARRNNQGNRMADMARQGMRWRRAMASIIVLGFVQTVSTAAADDAVPLPCRVLYTGHSFAGAGWLGVLTKQAGLVGYEDLGKQSLGASRVITHWTLADERNRAKQLLAEGTVDVLTLSPNMQMPDEGIDLFVDFALQHNPQIRVLVQGSWMTWDGLGKDGITNAQRDERPVAEIRERTAKHLEDIRTQLRATNARVGREVCSLVPVGTGVVRLREMIAERKLPGFEKPSQLFYDDIGHGKAPIAQLMTYLYYIAVLHRDPRPLPGLGNNGWRKSTDGVPDPRLTAMLQQLAWDIMQEEPLSGLSKK
jgi:hypothetical protein